MGTWRSKKVKKQIKRKCSKLYYVYFDKLYLGGTTPTEYIANEQPNTNYDLRSKFLLTDMVDVTIIETEPMNEEDLHVINKIRLSIPHYDVGEYQIGNLKIIIKKKV